MLRFLSEALLPLEKWGFDMLLVSSYVSRVDSQTWHTDTLILCLNNISNVVHDADSVSH